MRRRSFLVAASTVAARSAGHAGSRFCQAADYQPGRGRRQRGILLRVSVADAFGFQPRTWREVPPAPFAVSYVLDHGRSLAECRRIAKQHNQEQLRLGVCSWLVVVATDGRLASVKGGA